MRTIKFRGQRIDTKEWVYGDLIQYATNEILILPQFNRDWDIIEAGYNVIPETVGQFIGLLDKNKVEIYKGDLVRECGSIYEIVWQAYTCRWIMQSLTEGRGYRDIAYDYAQRDYEVIGTIHDNTDLF